MRTSFQTRKDGSMAIDADAEAARVIFASQIRGDQEVHRMIEFGIVVDTTTPNSIIPESFQKYRRSNGLQLFDILALTAAPAPKRPSYLLSRGSASPQQWQSEDLQAGKEVRS